MQCKHFGSCGSCTLYAFGYEEQLRRKKDRVASLLAPFYDGETVAYDSPRAAYRARAEFRIWHEGARCYYAMGAMDKKRAIRIEECPKVIAPIADRMWRLPEAVNASPDVLGEKLFGVEFLATTTGECLVTMLYHRKLDEAWAKEAKVLERSLSCKIMGRSRKQKVVLSDEFVDEMLTIRGEKVRYRQYEGGFTQPNPYVNTHMITWACEKVERIGGGDLLEAYCGLGNFTIPLSRYFDKVLATEISKRSIRAAEENCRLNGAENIRFVRMSSEEMVQALRKVRTFRRMEGIDLDTYRFEAVLVDPPRAGLDEATRTLAADIPHIVYISCNPETLARDLQMLCHTHRIVDAAIFDQFPYTGHIESGVFLERIKGK